MNALLDNGDEVLVPAPDYPLWTAAVVAVRRHAGALPVRRGSRTGCPTSTTSARRSRRAPRGIVVINPNNPTGALYPDELLQRDRRASRASTSLIVFADEIYDKMLYDGATHTSDRLAGRRRAVRSPSTACRRTTAPAATAPAGWWCRATRSHAERLHRRPEHAGLDAPVRQHAGPARDPDRARRLPEHQGPGGAGRAPVPAARPGLRAADRDSRASACVKPKAALYMFPRLDPKIYPIADDQQFAYELLAEEKVLIVQGTGFNWPRPTTSASCSCRTRDDLTDAIGRIATLPRALPQAGTRGRPHETHPSRPARHRHRRQRHLQGPEAQPGRDPAPRRPRHRDRHGRRPRHRARARSIVGDAARSWSTTRAR